MVLIKYLGEHQESQLAVDEKRACVVMRQRTAIGFIEIDWAPEVAELLAEGLYQCSVAAAECQRANALAKRAGDDLHDNDSPAPHGNPAP